VLCLDIGLTRVLAADHRDELPSLDLLALSESPVYEEDRVRREIIHRILSGMYENERVQLCSSDPERCSSKDFARYEEERDGVVGYSITIAMEAWDRYPTEVQDEVIRELVSRTWGGADTEYPPLFVTFAGEDRTTTPLDVLSPDSRKMFVNYPRRDSLRGGIGAQAFGPNCWYNAISAIADERSTYAKSRNISGGTWNKPRFMGPAEFRCHMKQFYQVSSPGFGDIARYYVDRPIYDGLVSRGEIHAAVVVGQADTLGDDGGLSRVVLTKNGYRPSNFLVYQDVRALDEMYLPPNEFGTPPSKVKKRRYFRVKEGASILDPATAGESASCYSAYRVDQSHYEKRWECLAGRLDPPPGESSTCYDYPVDGGDDEKEYRDPLRRMLFTLKLG
jgi:hypothetical protein